MAVLLLLPSELWSQEFLVDKAHPKCDNQGPGIESRPWCNLYGLHGRRFNPGSVVSIKAGSYVGDEDPDSELAYHDAIDIEGRGTADKPFTIRAWPGDEGKVEIHSASLGTGYSFLFRGSHIRFNGLTFIGHIDLPEGGRLYAPRVIRFGITTGPVHDIRFDSVKVLAFQGADDAALGCRWLGHSPVGECDIQRESEGWARGIDIADISDFVFENGEISCTDETGKVGLEEIRAQGLYLAADGVKSDSGCSDITFRNNHFYSCGHNDLMFSGCSRVLVENNYFENELHRSVGFTRGGDHIVRYNTFAAWERRRVELRNGGGNALQLRTSHSRVHHNLFYGGGEPRHQGAITMAGLGDFVVGDNEIFSNVMLGLNSMSFNLNDKIPEPYNLQNNKIYNNIFIGRDTERGGFNWEAATREAYFAGQTFGNEITNNIFYSPSGDPEVVSTSGFRGRIVMTQDEFNSLAVASGNIFGDPGLADVNFVSPDFHIKTSCIAINGGLPVDVMYDFDGRLIRDEGPWPSIGAYVADRDRVASPLPVQPRDGASGEQAFTVFYWEDVDGADSYHLEVSDDSLFGTTVLSPKGLRSTLYFAETPLAYSTRFFWRTRVASDGGENMPESTDCAPWSPTQTFTTAVGTGAEEVSGLPSEYALLGGFPNPFRNSTTIAYSLPEPSRVTLTVYDALGRVVSDLVTELLQAGHHSVEWTPDMLISGTYFYRLEAGRFSQTKSVRLVR